MTMRSISLRDWAPLFTDLSIDNSRSSLVSLSISEVIETTAACGVRLAAPVWACPFGRKLPVPRQNTINRASPALICFDILVFHSYSPLNVYSLNKDREPTCYEFGRLCSDDKPCP